MRRYSDRREYLRTYQREWVRKRKAKYFEDKVCRVCGSSSELELDHIDPKTKVSHNIWSWSEFRRVEELAKCQILCKKHHLEKTVSELTKEIVHGTSTAYKSKKCRCDPCKAWKSVENKLRYLKPDMLG